MANPDEMKAVCECQYTLGRNAQEIKNNFNNIPNMHEIDEEESETEEATILEQPPSPPASDEEDDKVARNKGTESDNESAYTGESFCSNPDDESCDESEVTNVTSGSLNSSLLLVADHQSSKKQDASVGGSMWENDREDESYSLSDEPPRAITADRFTKSRRCRRWNMSFTDEEMRRIERENELLLRKIMAQQKPRHKILDERTIQPKTSSSAINRRKLQKKIEDDNMLLLKRIQRAKPCVFTDASKMGCRLTFL